MPCGPTTCLAPARSPADPSSVTRVRVLRRHKHLLLLLTLIGILIVHSSAHSTVLMRHVLAPLSMLATFLVVFTGRRERTVALAVAAAALAVNWLQFLPAGAEHRVLGEVASHGLRVVFSAVAVGVILRNIFAEDSVTGDQVVGTVCGYLLASAAWAHAYALTEISVPGSFNINPELRAGPASLDGSEALFYYFSLVTLTTMGYGDVSPVRAPATVLATLEAIFGQFYIAVVVAQLVGLRLAQAFAPKDPPAR
jgi:Ion channel